MSLTGQFADQGSKFGISSNIVDFQSAAWGTQGAEVSISALPSSPEVNATIDATPDFGAFEP